MPAIFKNFARVGIAALLLPIGLANGGEPPRATQAERVSNGYSPEHRVEQKREQIQMLRAGQLSIDKPGISVRLTVAETDSIVGHKSASNQLTPLERRQRVGIVKQVSRTIDFGSLHVNQLPQRPESFSVGSLFAQADSLTWTALVEAVDATALRLHFSSFKLPQNAALYIYNDAGQSYGPYTDDGRNGSGSFWSHTLSGSQAYVQLRFSGNVTDDDLRGMHFTIADVAHIGPDYQYVNVWESCQGNASCVQLASGEDNLAVNDAKQAVAHMQFVSGRYIYLCSGGLLTDTDPNTERNYFLTANHCISKGGEANSLETFFLYNQCGSSVSTPPGTIGATILSSKRSSDYTLLELNGQVPSGTTRLGWTSASVAGVAGEPLYRISHPAGAPQSYSEHLVDPSAATCRSWPRGPWIYSRDSVGATEGGSSGSPVVNGAGQVVGQLSGACGYNVSDSCDSVSNATVDGAFASYFSQISQWLDTGASSGTQAPVANFGYTTTGLTVDFSDSSTDPDNDIVTWSWDFGDGASNSSQNPSHTYAAAGTYAASLTVTDADSAADTIQKDVSVTTAATNPISIASLTGSASTAGSRRNRWTATVDIGVGPALSGAVVSGSWSDLAKGSASCTTDNAGECSLSKSNLKSGGSATFTITGIELSGYVYSPAGKFVKIDAPATP